MSSFGFGRLQKDSKVHFVAKLEDGECSTISKKWCLTHAKVITRAKRSIFTLQLIKQPLMLSFSTLTDADGTILKKTISLQQKVYSTS